MSDATVSTLIGSREAARPTTGWGQTPRPPSAFAPAYYPAVTRTTGDDWEGVPALTGSWASHRTGAPWVQTVTGVVVGLIVLTACSSDENEQRSAATGDTNTVVAGPSTTPTIVHTTPTTGVTIPPTQASTTASTSVAVAIQVTGFAATREDWDRVHQPAPGAVPGLAYLPLLRTGRQPTYAGVIGTDRIISYDLYMEPGTTLEQAEQAVARELPPDAKPGRREDGGSCYIQEWRSPTIERLLEGLTAVVAYSKDDPSIPRDRRYRVATFITHTPGEQEAC